MDQAGGVHAKHHEELHAVDGAHVVPRVVLFEVVVLAAAEVHAVHVHLAAGAQRKQRRVPHGGGLLARGRARTHGLLDARLHRSPQGRAANHKVAGEEDDGVGGVELAQLHVRLLRKGRPQHQGGLVAPPPGLGELVLVVHQRLHPVVIEYHEGGSRADVRFEAVEGCVVEAKDGVVIVNSPAQSRMQQGSRVTHQSARVVPVAKVVRRYHAR
mmetsp:Transcript_47246/g.90185  ORF Transcript_47246/g.90185 Transcript_47246/m.90185 type:complete len:213 (+) Transcript_47246:1284-1922(+)